MTLTKKIERQLHIGLLNGDYSLDHCLGYFLHETDHFPDWFIQNYETLMNEYHTGNITNVEFANKFTGAAMKPRKQRDKMARELNFTSRIYERVTWLNEVEEKIIDRELFRQVSREMQSAFLAYTPNTSPPSDSVIEKWYQKEKSKRK